MRFLPYCNILGVPNDFQNGDSLGFRVWRARPRVMERAHSHCDIELNFLLSGEVEYFFAGHFRQLRPGEVTLFWAGTPHVLTRAAPETEMIWAVIPLAWFLQWRFSPGFVESLLRGQSFVLSAESELHRALLSRWCREWEETEGAPGATRKIISLELEALLHRVARPAPASTQRDVAGGAQIEKLTAFIARHYNRDLSVAQIARAAGLHPNYAMPLFKAQCGLSLWEYVTRLRVSHAQYLLLTTTRTLGDIARDAGFASESRFYAAFGKYAGCAPTVWRRRALGASA